MAIEFVKGTFRVYAAKETKAESWGQSSCHLELDRITLIKAEATDSRLSLSPDIRGLVYRTCNAHVSLAGLCAIQEYINILPYALCSHIMLSRQH